MPWKLGVQLYNAPMENSRSLPEMCKWNAFTIDSQIHVCQHWQLIRENIFHLADLN